MESGEGGLRRRPVFRAKESGRPNRRIQLLCMESSGFELTLASRANQK